MDSLRCWIQQMHVDGFRFDLAPTPGRQDGSFERSSTFFDLVLQDPVVSQVELIAEPWDVGQCDSYDIGHFPPPWSEWNGAFRGTVRDFWRGQERLLATYATRIAGSSDLYGGELRRPTASVNLVTAHDGFTLRDLVSYDAKHNDASMEGNRGGTDDNRSWNCGAEGDTADAEVVALRSRQQRAPLTTLLASFGVPMLLGGDEMGRTRQGNNNAYCQDTPLARVDWANVDQELLDYTRRLIRLRLDHPVLRRRRFLRGAQARDVRWFTPAGTAVTDTQWRDPGARAVSAYLNGTDDPDHGRDGSPLVDDDLLLCVNAWWEPLSMTVPDVGLTIDWTRELDSYDPAVSGTTSVDPVVVGGQLTVHPRSVLVLVGRRR